MGGTLGPPTYPASIDHLYYVNKSDIFSLKGLKSRVSRLSAITAESLETLFLSYILNYFSVSVKYCINYGVIGTPKSIKVLF